MHNILLCEKKNIYKNNIVLYEKMIKQNQNYSILFPKTLLNERTVETVIENIPSDHKEYLLSTIVKAITIQII